MGSGGPDAQCQRPRPTIDRSGVSLRFNRRRATTRQAAGVWDRAAPGGTRQPAVTAGCRDDRLAVLACLGS